VKKRNKRYSSVPRCRFLPALLLLLANAAIGNAENSYRDLCRSGVACAAKQQSDSAFGYFSLAYRQGMPRDSFYYFWAELFLDRGAIDSACVVNNAITLPRDSVFKFRILEQRYLIYSGLGWKEKAALIVDSLAQIGSAAIRPKNRFYLPLLAINLGGGLNDSRWENSHDNPFPAQLERDHVFGPDYRGEIKARWSLPLGGDWVTQASIGYLFINQARRTLSRDSLGNTTALSVGINWKVRCELNYSWRRVSNVAQPPSFIHTIGMNFLPADDKKGTLFFYGGYSILSSEESANQGSMATVLAYGAAHLPGKRTLTLSLNGTGQWYSGQLIEYPLSVMDVDDVTKAPDRVIHYYTYDPSTPIPTKFPPLTLTDYSLNTTFLMVEQYFPGDNYFLSSDAEYALPLPWSLRGSVGLGYLLQWFAQPYVWYTITPTATDDYSSWEQAYQSNSLWLAYNRKDGKYYLALEPKTASGFIADTFSAGPINITRHSKIRADQTIAARIGISRDFGRLGNLRLTYQASKTFSTLSGDPPVQIPDWTQSLSFRWAVNLSFR
jgi:hypothetical protein